MINSYYACTLHFTYFTRVCQTLHVCTRGLMPLGFFAFARACDTHGLFKLWVICIENGNSIERYVI